MDLNLASALLGILIGLGAGAAGALWLTSRRATELQPPLEPVLKPLDEALRQLQRLQQQVDAGERRRLEAHGELRTYAQLMGQSSEQLRVETAQLVTALRSPQVRGRWGEMQLRRVVELAGLVEHCDFEDQPTFSTDDGRIRPDLVVHLSQDRHVVVDAKVSFAGYLDALAATDPTVVDERMRAHARHLRNHVDELAAKRYWSSVANSPEFVVMFVPAEPFLTAALDQDPTLLEYAFGRNVVVTTPATLIALLRTVGLGWRQEALADNAAAVQAAGSELYGRLVTFAAHLAKVGSGLQTAVGSYNQAVGSWDSRVLVSARRLDVLDVGDQSLTDAEVLDLAVRPLRDTTSQAG
jgi:DNA recombination protein RmuC